jgi:hypothetical protein
MKTLNTTLLAATSILAAALSTSALAADKADQHSSATASQAAPADATSEKTRAEFLRARKAGELEYGHEFQIAETAVFKRAKTEAATPTSTQVASH